MALSSILLSVVAFACAVLGFFTTLIPVVGAAFSFAAPVLALIGIVLGGVAMSRAKREGKDTGLARAGVILSVIALVPALVVAMFCGTCNALFSTGQVKVQRDFRMGSSQQLGAAGAGGTGHTHGIAGTSGTAPTTPSDNLPAAGTGAGGSPALPPPPLPAGPRRDAPQPAPTR